LITPYETVKVEKPEHKFPLIGLARPV
jgi:hypothetical protein